MRSSSSVVSVVVPTRNRGEAIEQTIASILDTDPLPLEVVVADQSEHAQAELTLRSVEHAAAGAGATFAAGSVRHSLDDAPDPTARVRYLRCSSRGAGAGRNDGARCARGSIVLFTDDDTTVDPNWIAAVEHDFESDPSIVAVYGRILAPPRPGGDDANRTGVEVIRMGNRTVHTVPALPWDLGSGANMAFRRAEMLACGGFDEVLTIGGPFPSFEDLDLGHRLLSRRVGHVGFCPESVVFHHSTKSFAEQVHTEIGYGVGAGAAFTKYRRCADPMAWPMLRAWVWNMAVRRSAAGVLKWRSPRVVRLGLNQFWAPFVGIWRSRHHPIDEHLCLFVPADAERAPRSTVELL